ncbi:YCF48-related protein [Paenibacillus sp. FJAT-26967]|uniref:WD40/YVTN/BNR-like repeat-containing protein n=1 Tax=Paenibacillus sp. FJAT-26967 TaxID=1729690 RepID=UPI0008387609|nr:YCF48-related protein [Paenibacillus sp. FJAT-26967]
MRSRTILILTSLILAGMLFGCTDTERQAVPTLTPPPSQTPTPPPSTSPGVDTKKETPSEFQIQTRLLDFHLIDERNGYAWGVTKEALRMYRTEDGGQSWQNVSPPTANDFKFAPGYGQSVSFLDKQRGWVVRSDLDNKHATIFHTEDGGASWKAAELGEGMNPVVLDFRTPQSGWLLSIADPQQADSGHILYATSNAGTTWRRIADSSLPQGGTVTGMTFQNDKNGWLSMEVKGQPKLYRTDDGGMSWNAGQVLDENKQMQACEVVDVLQPVFFGTDRSNGWIPLTCPNSDTDQFHGLFTEDGGASWTYTPFKIRTEKASNAFTLPFFLNDTNGWYLNKNLVYHSSDKGLTWTPLNEDKILSKTWSKYPQLTQMQFISENVGWILLETKDQKRSVLVQTKDGGKSWSVL